MKIIGMARIGKDIAIRFMPNGDPVGELSLAFRLGKKNKDTGEYSTTWIKASLFGKRAETLAPYLTKGRLHCFYLRDLVIDEYVDKDGNKRTVLNATIEDVELSDSRADAVVEQVNKAPDIDLGELDDIPF